ncbi:LOW QUALITY PROTEIN: Reticulon [Purpureocillium lavendulum]|uniref:Reticulon-like protein n=1 Tax=Purpureocillium lavendulum TaxID=1247861 RepID=A0AB34G2H1_9HYPO|nr:LOW QUALITY PROTEIN: Reticulon [Purpureocillium lavendulum]
MTDARAGPVAQNVKDHSAKASAELSNLAASRKTPTNPAATGQPLTHYHSFFSELLSWKNPRASAIAYASIVSLIFAARYLDVIRWAFKLSWMALAVTVSAEAAGKLVLSHGLATQMRPRRYYTVSRATLDSMIGDVHELVNFFVIEAQRILFAENLAASAANQACVAAFISYYLVKLVPYWGLAVIGTTIAFFVPLIYTTNQELIDHHLKNASDAIGAQTAQVRSVAQKQADQLATMGKQYAGDYTGKVQEMLRGRSASPAATTKAAPAPAPAAVPVAKPVFPVAPTEEPQTMKVPEHEPEPVSVPKSDPLAEDPVAAEKEPMYEEHEAQYAAIVRKIVLLALVKLLVHLVRVWAARILEQPAPLPGPMPRLEVVPRALVRGTKVQHRPALFAAQGDELSKRAGDLVVAKKGARGLGRRRLPEHVAEEDPALLRGADEEDEEDGEEEREEGTMRARCCKAARVPPRACDEPMQMALSAGLLQDEAGASTKETSEAGRLRAAASARARARSAASVSTPMANAAPAAAASGESWAGAGAGAE